MSASINNHQSKISNPEPLAPGERLIPSDLPAAMADMVEWSLKRRG
jgi:hypothetical protein